MTQKAVDIIKDLLVYGTAAGTILYSLFAVTHLAELKIIDGATAMTYYSAIGLAAAGFVFFTGAVRQSARNVQNALNTPSPTSTTVNTAGDTTVTGSPVEVTPATTTVPPRFGTSTSSPKTPVDEP